MFEVKNGPICDKIQSLNIHYKTLKNMLLNLTGDLKQHEFIDEIQ